MSTSDNPPASRDRGYHHGDLAGALMDTAIRHIAADGTENLSLRALARECGVSATAPYRHFPSKRCLLAALATRGFLRLRERCRQSLDSDADLGDQLLALGLAYIDFATDNPTDYQLMFGSVIEDFSEYDMLADAAEQCYGVVLSVLEKLARERPGLGMTAIELGSVVWPAVHGISSLMLFQLGASDGPRPRTPQQTLRTLQSDPRRALELLIRGVTGGA